MKFKRITILSRFLVILCCFSSFNAFSQPAGMNGYELSGSLDGLKIGYVKLSRYDINSKRYITLDSVSLKDGKFFMQGKLNTAELMTLNFFPGNWEATVFLENAKMVFTADTIDAPRFNFILSGGQKVGKLKNFQLKGSKSQLAYEQYRTDLHGKKEIQYVSTVRQYLEKTVNEDPTSVVGAYLLYQFYLFDRNVLTSDLEQMLSKFRGVVQKSVYYSFLQEEIKGRLAVMPGKIADDFTLLQKDSTKFTLSTIKGKYVLIDFWASWCKPCREAIPLLKRIYNLYSKRDFEIVSITNDTNWSAWIKAMDIEDMPWPQLADDFSEKRFQGRIISRFKNRTIPYYVLLDSNREILLTTDNANLVEKKLYDIFSGPQ